MFFFCSLDEARGAGAEPPQKLPISTQQRSRFCRRMEQTAAGQELVPVPRCRRRNGTAKVREVKGLRVEIFTVLRLRQKKILPGPLLPGQAERRMLA